MNSKEILEKIIETYNLTQLASREFRSNSYSFVQAVALIEEFLAGTELESDVIYVPGGAGVVRVLLNRINKKIVVKSISTTPNNCPKTFTID